MFEKSDKEEYMQLAFAQAKKAEDQGEVPSSKLLIKMEM